MKSVYIIEMNYPWEGSGIIAVTEHLLAAHYIKNQATIELYSDLDYAAMDDEDFELMEEEDWLQEPYEYVTLDKYPVGGRGCHQELHNQIIQEELT